MPTSRRSWYGAPAAIVGAGLLLLGSPAAAQFGDLLEGLGLGGLGDKTSGLSDARIGEGLKEALEVATGNAVEITGQKDGYFANEAIKILMPEKLRSLETGLRAVGYGGQIDEFVLSMNRAAELAAPQAKQIFLDAIGTMTFDDAREILDGGDTAATDFFKAKTTPQLEAAFRPVVAKSIDEVGVTREYNQLVGRFEAIPFAKAQAFDLNGYVVDQGLEGLFEVLGDQEKKIRTDPAARVTELLQVVFER